MPSPFPGMDPYLEDPRSWRDVHHRLISAASDLLTDQLRPDYYVRIEERVYVDDSDDPGRSVWPDLHVESAPRRDAGTIRGGPDLVEVDEPVVLDTLTGPEISEAFIRILDRNDRSVVTVIEVLSPANKMRGASGGDSFERKRSEVLRSPSHWVEVDLLRAGHSWTPRPVSKLGPHQYLVHVSRADRRPRGEVWPIRLSRRLPLVAIPLRPGGRDAKLDVQAMLDTAYRGGSYDLHVDYAKPPVPPLKGEWAEWADRLLREKGLR